MQKENGKIYYYILFLIVLIIIVALYNLIGFSPDDHTQSELSVHHNGIFLNQPVTLFNNWNVFTLITYPIVWIKKWFPNYNIHGYFLILLTAFYISNYLSLFLDLFQEVKFDNQKYLISSLFILSVTFIFYNEILKFQYIKIAIHLILSGLIVYNYKSNKFYKTIAFISIIIGIMVRYESFVIAVLLFIFISLMYTKNYHLEYFNKFFKKNIYFVIVFISIIIFSNFKYTKADKLYIPYHTIINTIADFRFIQYDTTTMNKLDMSKLNMVNNYYFNDTIGITIKDISNLGIKPISRNPIDVIKKLDIAFSFKRGLNDFWRIIKNNNEYFILFIVTYLLLLFMQTKTSALKNLAILLFSFSLILLMSIYMDIQERFAIPILTFILIINIFTALKQSQASLMRRVYYILFVVYIYLCLSIYNISFLIKKNHEIEKQYTTINVAFKENNATIVFWDFYLFTLLDNRIASDFPLYNNKRDYSIDFPFGFALDAYKDRLINKFSTDKISSIIEQSTQHADWYYFTTQEHLEIFVNYINLQYHKNIVIKKKTNSPIYIDKNSDTFSKYYLFYLDNMQ